MSQPVNWNLAESKKDVQSITADWTPVLASLIDGVVVKEIKNILKNNGHLTEIYRNEWALDDLPVGQVFQVSLLPGGISAWHSHQFTTDRIFVNHGAIKVVLYDAREDSPTFGQINEFRCGILRPTLVVIPPKVWHGVQNYTDTPASLLNIVDQSCRYEDPDHWRISEDTSYIPYTFS